MRTCPKCSQTFSDDINYCLQDGTPLLGDADSGAATQVMPGTYSNAPTQILSSVPTVQQVAERKTAKWPFVAMAGLLLILLAGGAFLLLPQLRGKKTDVVVNAGKPSEPAANAAPSSKPATPANANSAANTTSNSVAKAPSDLNYASPTGHYAGDWISKMTSYGADVNITEVAGKVKGQIVWTLRSSPNPTKEGKIGLTATEYVEGTYDPKTRALELKGFRKDDPAEIIILDTYNLTVAEDNQTAVGKSINGDFILRRQ